MKESTQKYTEVVAIALPTQEYRPAVCSTLGLPYHVNFIKRATWLYRDDNIMLARIIGYPGVLAYCHSCH